MINGNHDSRRLFAVPLRRAAAVNCSVQTLTATNGRNHCNFVLVDQ